ncbi:unnamed protein product [Phytomonas sp. EM1]|nr:unnamed protein product [Phytomonas sp. EM1]|eukprot:CCW61612.1 unnamed protein product [Phytomonas sp. isolate EM1]
MEDLSAATPMYNEPTVDYTGSPRRRVQRIDTTKLKTKVCRNYAHGLPCPFEHRCAFSHGETAIHSPTTGEAEAFSPNHGRKASLTTREEDGCAPTATAMRRVESGGTELDVASSDVNSDSISLPPPPPAYEIAIQEDLAAMVDESSLPPAYPTRYRFDPYSYSSVRYE